MASTKITRTQVTGSANGTKIFTISVWFKVATTTTTQSCIWSSGTASTDSIDLHIDATNQLTFESWDGSSNPKLQLSRKLRDPGAWYHVVMAVDSTEAVNTNRLKMWVNGVQETAFGSSTYPTLNYDFPGTGVASDVTTVGTGTQGSYTGNYFNGEMSHFHFIEGTAYTASTFGETDATSGIWKIKTSPTVTYGNNGFFLKMEDRTNLDLDSSPNALTFTTTGTITATYDNPSNNFATLNSLNMPTSNKPVFSNGNNTVVTQNYSAKYFGGTSTLGMVAGKWYCECKASSLTSNGMVGINGYSGEQARQNSQVSYSTSGFGYNNVGQKCTNLTDTSYGTSYTTSNVIGIAVDLDNLKIYFAKDNTWQDSGDPTSGATGTGAAFTILAASATPAGFYAFSFTDQTTGSSTWDVNFGNGYFGTTAVTSAEADGAGEGAFEFAPPTGYYALCTKNIKAYG